MCAQLQQEGLAAAAKGIAIRRTSYACAEAKGMYVHMLQWLAWARTCELSLLRSASSGDRKKERGRARGKQGQTARAAGLENT